jgi:hypothetical protein
MEEEKKDPAASSGNPSAQPLQEKIKKKRGRKPKSFYIQQQAEQERAAREQAE